MSEGRGARNRGRLDDAWTMPQVSIAASCLQSSRYGIAEDRAEFRTAYPPVAHSYKKKAFSRRMCLQNLPLHSLNIQSVL